MFLTFRIWKSRVAPEMERASDSWMHHLIVARGIPVDSLRSATSPQLLFAPNLFFLLDKQKFGHFAWKRHFAWTPPLRQCRDLGVFHPKKRCNFSKQRDKSIESSGTRIFKIRLLQWYYSSRTLVPLMWFYSPMKSNWISRFEFVPFSATFDFVLALWGMYWARNSDSRCRWPVPSVRAQREVTFLMFEVMFQQ